MLITWIMSYDAVTVIAASIAALARNRYVSWLGFLLMAVNHTPLAVVGLALAIPVMLLVHGREQVREAVIRIVGSVVAVGLGAAYISWVVEGWGGATSRLQWFQALGSEAFRDNFVPWIPLIAFSALGVGWFILSDSSMRSNWVVRLLLVETVVVTIVMPLIVLDQSRVIALSLLVPLFTWIAHAERVNGLPALDQVWRRYAIAAMILPVMLMWEGKFLYVGWTVVSDLPAFWEALP